MFRRVASISSTRVGTMTQTPAIPQIARRSFYHEDPGMVGTSYTTGMVIFAFAASCQLMGLFMLKKVVWGVYQPTRQFGYCETTDMWNDDGTVLEGEEAVANLKIQHERMMPFMDKIQEQINAATA